MTKRVLIAVAGLFAISLLGSPAATASTGWESTGWDRTAGHGWGSTDSTGWD